jgi:Ca-activated chloride channel family protein
MILANPEYLFLLLLIIPAVTWYVIKRKKRYAAIQVSNSFAFENVGRSWKERLEHLPFILRM